MQRDGSEAKAVTKESFRLLNSPTWTPDSEYIAARKHFTREDLVSQTEGVECRKDKGVIDEIPGAYKDIDQVMENQADLVEVVHTLKQVLCVKG